MEVEVEVEVEVEAKNDNGEDEGMEEKLAPDCDRLEAEATTTKEKTVSPPSLL